MVFVVPAIGPLAVVLSIGLTAALKLVLFSPSLLNIFFRWQYGLGDPLAWIKSRLDETPEDQPRFVFLNVGETHVPYWHQGASWDRWRSPCLSEVRRAAHGRAVVVRKPAWSGLMVNLVPS